MLPFMLLQTRFDDPAFRWTIICLGLLAAVYLILRPKMRKKDPLARQLQQQQQNPGGLTLAQQRGLERDMSTLVTELLDMSRQMTAQMETRAAKLEILLKEADDKIAQLRALSGHAQNGDGQPAAQAPVPAAPTQSAPAAQTSNDPRYEQIYALASQGQSVSQIAREVGMPSGEIELILAFWRTGKG